MNFKLTNLPGQVCQLFNFTLPSWLLIAVVWCVVVLDTMNLFFL